MTGDNEVSEAPENTGSEKMDTVQMAALEATDPFKLAI